MVHEQTVAVNVEDLLARQVSPPGEGCLVAAPY